MMTVSAGSHDVGLSQEPNLGMTGFKILTRERLLNPHWPEGNSSVAATAVAA